MEWSFVYMVVGFALASYSIVANDAIQTLGTFLSSNSKRPWWVLWLFAVSVLTVTIVYGWFAYNGDVSYGRLSAKFPVPEVFSWIHVIPPLAIVILTHYGIPVSTTFLVLTVFAPKALSSILVKSISGYAVAFVVGYLVYRVVVAALEKKFIDKPSDSSMTIWSTLQWISTGFLWSQWLIQDLANIFVYMPTRTLSVTQLLIALAVLLGLHGLIIYRSGGKIQKIVTNKTQTHDIRSATIIDFIYALILLFFKQISNIPMSTTWVFLGLLAGREIAMTIKLKQRDMKGVTRMVFQDMGKAFLGLIVSVVLALGLPYVAKFIG